MRLYPSGREVTELDRQPFPKRASRSRDCRACGHSSQAHALIGVNTCAGGPRRRGIFGLWKTRDDACACIRFRFT